MNFNINILRHTIHGRPLEARARIIYEILHVHEVWPIGDVLNCDVMPRSWLSTGDTWNPLVPSRDPSTISQLPSRSSASCSSLFSRCFIFLSLLFIALFCTHTSLLAWSSCWEIHHRCLLFSLVSRILFFLFLAAMSNRASSFAFRLFGIF